MSEPHSHLKRRSMLRIQQLDMLLHLVETRSISETADKLGLTQSAVTKSPKELESSFSVRLFDRTSRGLRPTAYGEVLERFAHDAVIGLQSAHETIRALRFGERGHVGLGLVPGASQSLAARALQRLRSHHGDLSIELQVDLSDALLQALHVGMIDIALVHPSANLDIERFHYVPAGTEPLHALVHPNHPLLREDVGKRARADTAWALPSRDEPLRQLLDSMFARHGLPPARDVIELPLHAGAAELAQKLDIIVVLPDSMAQPFIECHLLRRIDLPFELPSLPLALLRSRHAEPSAGACLVMEALIQEIASEESHPIPGHRPQ